MMHAHTYTHTHTHTHAWLCTHMHDCAHIHTHTCNMPTSSCPSSGKSVQWMAFFTLSVPKIARNVLGRRWRAISCVYIKIHSDRTAYPYLPCTHRNTQWQDCLPISPVYTQNTWDHLPIYLLGKHRNTQWQDCTHISHVHTEIHYDRTVDQTHDYLHEWQLNTQSQDCQQNAKV